MAKHRKNPYAVALGRKGGKKGGPARAASMTPEERSESAKESSPGTLGKGKGKASIWVILMPPDRLELSALPLAWGRSFLLSYGGTKEQGSIK